MRKPGKIIKEQTLIDYSELQRAKISERERRYAKLPKENIPDLIKYDHQDYTNWKKLPRLI